jgi:1-deoxy-D-xylulose-5-phosphate reductoisomerase
MQAGRAGGAAPAVFNAANEQAVALFLEGRITFIDIATSIDSALDTFSDAASGSREALLAVDADARRHVRSIYSC